METSEVIKYKVVFYTTSFNTHVSSKLFWNNLDYITSEWLFHHFLYGRVLYDVTI